MSERNGSNDFYIPINKDTFMEIKKYKKFKWVELSKTTGWTVRGIRRAINRGYMPYSLYTDIMDYLHIGYLVKINETICGTKKDNTPFIISDEWRSDKIKAIKEKKNGET